MLEAFIDKRFSGPHQEILEAANVILQEYGADGYKLTLRQLYYQFVARGWMENKQTEYKRLGNIVNDGRLAGLIDWSLMEDRTRWVERQPCWEDPHEILRTCAAQFRVDMWENQPHLVEVHIEKQALVGVIEPICQELRVPFFACRGYTSQSAAYEAGLRYRMRDSVKILHLGDHDPSGIDMTRDNDDRFRMFAGDHVEVIRLALNMDQVEEYKPPPNPAKLTDSRAREYCLVHGYESWELDALKPEVISQLIRDAVDRYRDEDQWSEDDWRERAFRGRLKDIADGEKP